MMDPFTERMLERAKSRREKLDNQKMILEQRSPLQEKVKNKEDVAVNGVLGSEKVIDTKGKQYITSLRKSKLQKLANFYSGNDENFLVDDKDPDEKKDMSVDLCRKHPYKLNRLNELATKIKQWEDDTDHTKHSSSGPGSGLKKTEEKSLKKRVISEKQKFWDSAMVEKLCSQGFSLTESKSTLMYDFKNKKEILEEKNLARALETPAASFCETEKSKTKNEKLISTGNQNVLRKAAFFESSTREEQNRSVRDPAELSLAERKALFEQNNGERVLPKSCSAVIGATPNCFIGRKKLPQNVNDPGRAVCSEKKENNTNEILETNKIHPDYSSGKEDAFPCTKTVIDMKTVSEEIPIEKPIVCEVICNENIAGEKELTNIPPPPPLPSDFQNGSIASISLNQIKDVKSCNSKGPRLYPSLSNLDITDESEFLNSEIEPNESKNSNFCLNMTLTDLLEMSKNNPITPPSDQSFSKTKESQVLNKMDKLLEDALNDLSSSGNEEDNENIIPSPPKMKKSSSFEYKSGQENQNFLLHTVSFYRKQQKQHSSCLDSEYVTCPEPSPEEDQDETLLVKNKIEMLIAEVNKQQTIISQASQALNLCLSTVEFSGSGEQVEGERLLLLASHKRQACLNEIQRLKIENSLLPQGENQLLAEKGDVSLSNISVKLKRDALRAIAAAENLQYFVCLIKSDERVLATPAVPASRDNLRDLVLQFPGQVKLEGLLGNFKITVEVYNLELGKELLPHDVKYHIVTKKEKKLLTPIKSKKSESKLVKPQIHSPAGPNAVRSSNFQMCGYIVFSLREVTRTQWILNKVPYVSPLEGTLSMNIQSQLRLDDELRGFLTMFDDISGFGAWHRRWCLLSSHFISYWKYPDDEHRKVPNGTIDLRCVVTENVGLVSRDICARLNTFLLETTRPRLNDDKSSLVVNIKDDVTTIRHLLSADSRQEMMMWCQKLNKTLALLRSWKCNFNE